MTNDYTRQINRCYEQCVDGFSLVNFPGYGDRPDIATISVHDEDLRVITKEESNGWINDWLRMGSGGGQK